MPTSTILIIEDNPMNLDMARDILEHSGYRVLAADQVDAGMDLMRADRPDLILLDLHLPDKDGFEAARMIKADPQLAPIPLIAFTALAYADSQEKARAHGCDGVITKPIDLDRFLADIARYLEKSGA